MVAVTTVTSRPGRPVSRPHLSVVAPGRIRLVPAATYRRRRLAALVVAAGLAFVAWLALGALGGALTAPVRSTPLPPETATVVVAGPGDSLWTIARRLQPKGDLRPLVDRLVAVNGGTVVHVGDRLVVG